MMRFTYRVMDNGRDANYLECGVDDSWAENEFDTLEEAEDYARNWLGVYAPDGNIGLNTPYYYGGADDYIIILQKVS